MKKTITIVALLLCFTSLFAVHLYVGGTTEYRPFHPELTNPENLFRKDSYYFGAEASVETKFFILEADSIINSLKKDSFCIENNFYNSANIPICRFYNLSVGFGLRTALEKAASDNKLYFTIGGVRPSAIVNSVKNRPELLLQILQFKFVSRFYLNRMELDLGYIAQPSRIGKEIIGGTARNVIESGIATLSIKYKVF